MGKKRMNQAKISTGSFWISSQVLYSLSYLAPAVRVQTMGLTVSQYQFILNHYSTIFKKKNLDVAMFICNHCITVSELFSALSLKVSMTSACGLIAVESSVPRTSGKRSRSVGGCNTRDWCFWLSETGQGLYKFCCPRAW